MSNSQPPFFIGQRVVCIKTHSQNKVIKGESFFVTGLEKCLCGYWSVDIGHKLQLWKMLDCPQCPQVTDGNGIMWYGSELFAPVQESYTDISKELADSFKDTEETPDRIIVPEHVVNN